MFTDIAILTAMVIFAASNRLSTIVSTAAWLVHEAAFLDIGSYPACSDSAQSCSKRMFIPFVETATDYMGLFCSASSQYSSSPQTVGLGLMCLVNPLTVLVSSLSQDASRSMS